MKKTACIIIALVVLMIVSLASAEEVECQMQYPEVCGSTVPGRTLYC